MTYKNPFDQVWEFQESYGLPSSRIPSLPSYRDDEGRNLRDLRKRLLEEEYNEYLEGEENNDLVEIADALGDIMYIAYGTGITYGLPMDEIFNEIHRSNMSKLGADGKPIRREDGKLLKGPNFSPPDIAGIIAKHIERQNAAPPETEEAYSEIHELVALGHAMNSANSPTERFAVYLDVGNMSQRRAREYMLACKTAVLASAKERNDDAVYYFFATRDGTSRIERL